MKSLFKWLFIIGGVFLVLIIAAVIIIPQFVDVKKYKPTIEQKVAEATGRSFTLGDDMDLSVFPWVGVRLTDLHLGNPAGHKEKDMVSVKSFEVRLKVMPLLSKRIEVKTFVLDSPKIYLEKLKNGTANWEGLGKQQEKKADKEKKKGTSSSDQGLPIEALRVDNFSIINGELIYVDRKAAVKKEISDLSLKLENISLENPIGITLSARVDGKSVSIKTRIKGNKDSISLSDGLLAFDDSKLTFSGSAKEFSKPNLTFDLQLDGIDLDRYLPESSTKKGASPSHKKTKPAESAKKKTDYGPLRKLVLDGKIKIGKVKAHGAIVENVDIRILAENGIITIDPLGLSLYQGSVLSKVKLNVQKKYPRTNISLDAKGIQAGPLMKDALQKELIEGTLKTNLTLSMKGESAARIKKTLTGQGEILFTDGAIVGIDLANAVRNIKANFGAGEQVKEKPRTDFAELKIPFTAKKGLVNTSGSSLTSPLIRVLVTGKTDLVKEMLDLRVEPKFVATLKGQGDTKQRSGLMVPVLITGSFSDPKIRPDLEGMLGSGITPDAEGLKNILGTKDGQKETIESTTKDVKKQIKSLIPGFTN
ncbi:MAG: hypothetical protein DRH93_13165 [Deltaproteobacteria bacterium]|nr:MAG: hypothetical protein DRH93_13165 [Deltaproteobacteria bacterium]